MNENTLLEFPLRSSNWKSLLGFHTEAEAMTIIRSQGIPLDSDKEQALSEQIRMAVEHVRSFSGRRTLRPQIIEIPEKDFQDRRKKLEDEPTFREHLVGIHEHSLASVEIDKLHAFQPNLNIEYVERLKQRAPSPGDIAGLLKFCLPLRDEVPKSPALGNFNANSNTFTLTSENLDLRILGSVQGEEPTTGRTFFGFAYGKGLPQMSVVEYQGMYMIKNGYHRAYALLEGGHKSFPCILLRTDNYNATGATGAGFFSIDLMMSDRSPLLSDFSSPAAITYPRRLLRVIVSIHAEVQVIPV
jgi:hypothetical protein